MPDIVFLNSIQPPKQQTIFVLFVLENKAQALDLSVDYDLKKKTQHNECFANLRLLLVEALVLWAVPDSQNLSGKLPIENHLPASSPSVVSELSLRTPERDSRKAPEKTRLSITTLFPRALGKAGSEQRCLHDLNSPT